MSILDMTNCVQVHQFDIVLDVLLVNQTTETLQNLTVEFATLGDLKVVERPPTQNVGPHDFINLQATIKGTLSVKPFVGPH